MKNTHNINMKKLIKQNIIIFIPLIILTIISLLNMYNSKLISLSYSNSFNKQLLWFIIGYLTIIIINFVNFKKIFKLAKWFYLFSILLLILVLLLGININGSKCWLNILGISFQPSEICKLALTLYLIQISQSTKKKNIKEEIILIIKLFLITLIPSILVFLEPDTGAIINYLIIFMIVLFSSKINKWWYIIGMILIAGFITVFFISYFYFQDKLIHILGTSIFYRMDRIINFTKGNSYQLENALVTIGASSFLGVGMRKILLYIPEAPTDFIFAFTIGNYGIISGLLIIISYLIIDLFLIYKNNYIDNKKIHLFINSFLGIFIFQQIYNIFMNLGLLPIMGIPLPFLSYGGTSIIVNYIFISIILNFIKNKNTIY